MSEPRTPPQAVDLSSNDQHAHPVFRLSWVAYLRELWSFGVRLLVFTVIATLLSLGLDRFGGMQTEAWLPLLGVLPTIAVTAYSVMFIKSVRLFTDETGVWMQSGVFPWEKGITGVQWRDVGQASYTQGFASWALRSYSVRVSHRFTTDSELYLRHVSHGNLAVEHVNGVMARLQGRVIPS